MNPGRVGAGELGHDPRRLPKNRGRDLHLSGFLGPRAPQVDGDDTIGSN
ncbi:hypothetical protein ABR737_02440 [Streptomyces sp. Edi2]